MKKSILFLLVLTIISYLVFVTYKSSLMYDYLGISKSEPQKALDKGELIKTIALLADSHTDYQRLQKAVEKANSLNVDFTIHLGDLSDFGGVTELAKTKSILDTLNSTYIIIPGDRDVVEGGKNFKDLFGNKVCFTDLIDIRIICLANPYNYTLLEDSYLTEFYNNLDKSSILITSQPIYNPNSNVYMGFYNKQVKEQAEDIYSKIVKLDKPLTVISGDGHFFNTYTNKNTRYYNLGAITDKKNLQTPNFAILYVYQSGYAEVKQITID